MTSAKLPPVPAAASAAAAAGREFMHRIWHRHMSHAQYAAYPTYELMHGIQVPYALFI